MSDDPIRAPRPGPVDDGALAAIMTALLEAAIGVLPQGAVVTIMTTFPENTPGLVQKTPGSRTNYISNGDRADMAEGMIELLKRWGKL